MATLFWFTIRQAMRLRRLWFVVLLLAGPSGLVLLLRHFERGTDIERLWEHYHSPMVFLLFMIVLPLLCMLQGSALIGSETDGRTLVYLTTRRMRRETVLVVRFAAVWMMLTILALLAAVAFHFCAVGGLDIDGLNDDAGWAKARAWAPGHDLLGYLRAIPLAVGAFLAVFTLISLVVRRSLVTSLLYLVFVEMLVSNVPARAQVYTISHQLKRMMNASVPHLLDMLIPSHSRELVEPFYGPGKTGVVPLIGVILAALTLAGIAMRTRELQPAKTGRD